MRALTRSYLQHANRHLPEGSDPLPFQLSGDVFHASYAAFSKAFSAVPSNTRTVFDLSTAGTVSQSESTSTSLAGTSWTATNFSYDTSDSDYLHILTQGIYIYEAVIWLGDGTTPTGSPFSACIEETGILFDWGLAGADGLTQQYLDPGFTGGTPSAAANMNVYRTRTYYLGNPGVFPAKRGMSFAHNYGSNLDIAVGMVVFRVSPP